MSMVNVKPPHPADLELESMKKFISGNSSTISGIVRNAHKNFYGKCSNLFWRSNSMLSVTKTAEIVKRSWN